MAADRSTYSKKKREREREAYGQVSIVKYWRNSNMKNWTDLLELL